MKFIIKHYKIGVGLKNIFLFLVPSFIWGSTWLVITFQLGIVDPLVSVVYRFMIAAVILLLFLSIRGDNLKFNRNAHLFMAAQGFFLFGINYWLVYLAELHLTSGIVAIIFATLVFMNIFNSSIFLKNPIRLHVL
ncbi:EamA family transporter, partial [candidate division KSB1 bacterium]|nr:EamA family transporter [candidate division KSB1 bacterium]